VLLLLLLLLLLSALCAGEDAALEDIVLVDELKSDVAVAALREVAGLWLRLLLGASAEAGGSGAAILPAQPDKHAMFPTTAAHADCALSSPSSSLVPSLSSLQSPLL